MTPPADDLDPARLESASFDVVRRGFDPNAVRGELQRAAQEIRRLRLERDELSGRLAEFDGLRPDQIEAHRVAEALGVEATQVIEAAHAAARERAERAEREADAVRDEALTAAEQTRQEARSQRDEMLEATRREAEEIVEDGRQRGRDMVAEAQTVRERMLRDLARKRQTGRAQVEQLRAGRDRLLESLTVAQESLDTAVSDLVNSVPEARAAAERAGLRVTSEPTPTPEQLEGEIEAARLVGHPLVEDVVDPGPVDDTFITGEMEALTHLDVLEGDDTDPDATVSIEDTHPEETPSEEDAVPAEAEDADAVSPEDEDAASSQDEDAGSVEDEVDRDQVETDQDTVGSSEESVDPDDDGVELYDVEAEDVEETRDVEDRDVEEVEDAEATEDAGEAPVVPAADVDDVFAKLRSAQEVEPEPESDPEPEDETEPEVEPEPDVDPDPEPEAEPAPAGAVASDGTGETADEGLDVTRAGARRRAADAAAKAMKKVLVEEQGTLLDGVRRSGADALGHVTDDPTAHRAAYEKAAAVALKDLASDLGGSKRLSLVDAFAQIDAIALAPVRQRLGDVAERVEDPDEISDTVRALYRESRSRRLDEAAAAAAVAVDGLVALATADGPLAWHVEPGGPCGPDCADNALAGAVPGGEEFPTGDRHPPAHPACTCWLDPVID